MNSGDEVSARTLFEGCPKRDLISWNAIITGYINENQSIKALCLFKHFILEVEPNSVTSMNALSSCTDTARKSASRQMFACLCN